MPRRRYAYDGLELTQESQNSSEFWSWAIANELDLTSASYLQG